MPAQEAGLCADGTQRRYLWTDAFGVLAYLSLAEHSQSTEIESAQFRQAAHTLIDTVHKCLGKPRSNQAVDRMTPDTTTPTGYVGLRIGKTETRPTTDYYGMHYDGQYWHYIDKWLFALCRAGRMKDGIRIAKSVFPYFFDVGSQGDGTVDGGMRWKLSVDATPPPFSGLPHSHVGANDDTLVALIVFSMLEHYRVSSLPIDDDLHLTKEIQMLQQSLQNYQPRVTTDPLGWGMEVLYDQFVDGRPRRQRLVAVQDTALYTSHLTLPFRLYGALMGAQILTVESVLPQSKVDALLQLSLEHEANAQRQGHEEHSSINRVMLAMCLLSPGVLGRRPRDPWIQI
jgi:hypothetical protein